MEMRMKIIKYIPVKSFVIELLAKLFSPRFPITEQKFRAE